MNPTLRQLLIAASIGILSLGVQAQTPSAAPPATAPGGAKTLDDADYQAAVAKCNSLSGSAKESCLIEAKKAKDRGLSANPVGAQDGAGASGKSSGSGAGMPGSDKEEGKK